jgi:hypothetical protein
MAAFMRQAGRVGTDAGNGSSAQPIFVKDGIQPSDAAEWNNGASVPDEASASDAVSASEGLPVPETARSRYTSARSMSGGNDSANVCISF